jgi:hypothetical protein
MQANSVNRHVYFALLLLVTTLSLAISYVLLSYVGGFSKVVSAVVVVLTLSTIVPALYHGMRLKYVRRPSGKPGEIFGIMLDNLSKDKSVIGFVSIYLLGVFIEGTGLAEVFRGNTVVLYIALAVFGAVLTIYGCVRVFGIAYPVKA